MTVSVLQSRALPVWDLPRAAADGGLTSRLARRRAVVSPPPHGRGQAPSCSLKARPQPHPGPAPSWEDLLGRR